MGQISLGDLKRQASLVPLLFLLPGTLCDGHSRPGACDMTAARCEFHLDVSPWLPMRRGNNEKVYMNETDGRLYLHDDESYSSVDPDDVVLADGSSRERALTLFNKTMPGPTLIVYVNQEVVVHVKNHMLSDGVTVHFHGIEMRGTPWMDGAAFVTQCPILPGQAFTYRFTPNRKGTYYYHSHTGAQISMGLVGAFIVKERKLDEIQEHVMLIQDYDNTQSSDEIYASTALLGFISTEGEKLASALKIDGTFSPVIKTTSSLINGRGRVFDENGTQLTNTPLSVFSVNRGKSYRFRVIGGGYALQHKVSIDSHKLKLVAADGNDIEPITAEFFIIHSGERFDFIIEANQTVGNYWIRAETLQKFTNYTGFAVLRYEGAADVDPASATHNCSRDNICTVVNCPFETYPNWNCIPTDGIRALDTRSPAANPKSGKFKEYFVNLGFAQKDNKVYIGHMNGVSLKLPSVSALTQPREVTGLCDDSHGCSSEKFCSCNRPLNVDFGDIVQINLFSAGKFNVVSHPIHVHGYSFHVLKVGFRQTDANFANLGTNPNIHCSSELCYYNFTWTNQTWKGGDIPDVDLSLAPRKDTVTVPAGGYVVIRFIADNPGLWYIHCHQEYHVQKGLGLLLNDSFSKVPPPPSGFPECRDFPAPDWLTSENKEIPSEKEENTTVSSSDGRTFTEEEFWGMFGALLFVILLQFIISIWCMKRNKTTVTL